MYSGYSGGFEPRQNPYLWLRVAIAVGIGLFSLIQYTASGQKNPVTGQVQRVAMTPEQEIELGQSSTPQIVSQYGGESSEGPDVEEVRRVGQILTERTEAAHSPYQFAFHLLNDAKTVNAFALPGGQVFITKGLMLHLQTEGQLAGVLGHEMGHVVARHGAQQLAKQNLTVGLEQAGGMAAYGSPNARGVLSEAIGQLVNLKYSRADELEADGYGVKFSSEAGWDPRAMLGVMNVLASLSRSGSTPEILQTHPDPDHRADRIREEIDRAFPTGVPGGLKP